MTVFRNPEIQLLSLFFTVKNRIVLGSHTHKRQSNKENKCLHSIPKKITGFKSFKCGSVSICSSQNDISNLE